MEGERKSSEVRAREVFAQSDRAVTKAFYEELERRGPAGAVAINLMRAQKASSRAKQYHGGIRGVGSFSSLAYANKSQAMLTLCKILESHGSKLRIRFGWKEDPSVKFGRSSWVLYVDLPQGQVSFHCPERLSMHTYTGEWDHSHSSEDRILEFCQRVYEQGIDSALQLPLF